jgi:hypothetical protein
MAQLHKRFTDTQVKEFLSRYLKGEIKRLYLQEVLGIKQRRFWELVKRYQQDPSSFSIHYARRNPTRTIAPAIEKNILKELSIEKKLIGDKQIPLHSYNYSYIKDRLQTAYDQKVSVPTIIDRAKKKGFYLKKPQRRLHDREVLTQYIGQLIQHDSSHHLWAPAAQQKWYLITSLDDYSRFILYAALLKRETSWAHIVALQTVFLQYGCPLSYYVDSHSIFRFVQGRDSLWREHHRFTDEVDPQWKQVLDDCGVKVTYALSPQAKGKIERPYRWIQDRLVRTCVRENVADIGPAQTLLKREIQRYNFHQVHSTTLEIPYLRFQKAMKLRQSLFREFKVKTPFQSVKDIFCLRLQRTADAYRRISLNNLQLPIHGANPADRIQIRLYPLNASVSELRFWHKNRLLDVHTVKNSDLKALQF